MNKPTILAIDTSCDETSVAVTSGFTILSNVISSQIELHKPYGGVFPTVAKQAHRENIDQTIKIALKRAQKELKNIDAVAVTQGPGLAPALEVGIKKAKELASKFNKKLIAVNHIEGHAISVLCHPMVLQNEQPIIFPVLALVISGGHSEFILIKKLGDYERIGFSIDDAAGECLDKVGRILNLGYPAGPVIEKFAKNGDENKFSFPLPMASVDNFNLSFSGLKTHAHRLATSMKLDKQATYDFCASFQKAVFKHICHKLTKILQKHQVKAIWLGGGVASNTALRKIVRQTIKPFNLQLITPYTKKLCGDNAVMIGGVAFIKFKNNEFVKKNDLLDRKPNWQIDS